MMPVGKREEDDRRPLVQQQASEILASLNFAPEPEPASITSMSSKQLRKHLRSLLMAVQGDHWRGCIIEEHRMPDGRALFSASMVCLPCQTIHTFVVTAGADGGFEFCAPLEDE